MKTLNYIRLAAVIAALLSATALSAQTTYNLSVCGTKVTSSNASDIRGDGVFTYQPENNTLYIKGDVSVSGYNIISNQIPGLKVIINQKSITLTTTANAISTSADMTILSYIANAKLTVNTKLNGISVTNGAQLRIWQIDFTLDAKIRGIYGDKSSSLLFDECKVSIPEASSGAVFDFADITFNRCAITSGGSVSGGRIVDGSGSLVKYLVIGEEKYDLWIAGTQVTSANCGDILGDGRTFAYFPEVNQLWVSKSYNNKSSGEVIIGNSIPGLKVVIKSKIQLYTSGRVITTTADMELTGDDGASLYMDCSNGINVEETTSLLIHDLNLEINTKYTGIYGRSTCTLTFDNCTAYIVCSADNYSPVMCFKSVEFVNCAINHPYDGYYADNVTNDLGRGSIVSADGKLVSSVSIGEKMYGLQICGVNVTDKNCDDILGIGVLSYDAESNTLNINGRLQTSDYNTPIKCFMDGMTINVAGPSAIINPTGSDAIYVSANNITITGDKQLLIVGNLYCDNDLITIKDCRIAINGQIESDKGNISVVNSDIMLMGSMLTDGKIELKDSYIAEPTGAKLASDGHRILSKEGNLATDILIVRGTGGGSGNRFDVNGDGSIDTQDVLNIYDEMQKQ